MQNSLLPSPQNPGASLPPAGAGLTKADMARLRSSLDSSVFDNTWAMYNSAWRAFETWAQARGALSLPASPPLVAAYLAHLAEERRLPVATVRLHKAALAAVHRGAGHPDPTDNEGGAPGDQGHRSGPRKGPETGAAAHRRGLAGGEGHRRHPATLRRPWKGIGVGTAGFLESQGGPGLAGYPAGWAVT